MARFDSLRYDSTYTLVVERLRKMSKHADKGQVNVITASRFLQSASRRSAPLACLEEKIQGYTASSQIDG